MLRSLANFPLNLGKEGIDIREEVFTIMTMNVTFAKPIDRIEPILRDRGLTLTWLASEVGLSLSYLHDLLNDRRGVRSLVKHAPRIAAVLGVPVGELFPALAEPAGRDAS